MKPILLQWNNVTLYSYPLFIGLAWGLAFRMSELLLIWQRKDLKNLKWLFTGMFVFAWFGAKIVFLLASSKDSFGEYALSSNFWLGGGFVFYGGLIGGSLFTFFFCKKLKQFDIQNVYLLLPALTFAHAIGRIGCFLAGCCYGAHCELPFAVHMHGAYRHPVQLYETFGLITIGAFMLSLIKKKSDSVNLLRTYIIGYGLLRFGLEFFRGDKVRGIYFAGLSTSQLISIALVLIIVLEILLRKKITQQELP